MSKLIKYIAIFVLAMFITGCAGSNQPKFDDRVKKDLEYVYTPETKVLTVEVKKEMPGKGKVNSAFYTAAKFYKSKGLNYMVAHKKNKMIPFFLGDLKNLNRLCFQGKNEDMKLCKMILNEEVTFTMTFIGLETPIFSMPTYSVDSVIAESLKYKVDLDSQNIAGTDLGKAYQRIFKLKVN